MDNVSLGWVDTAILVVYALSLVGMGIYFTRKSKTSEQFMVASRSIPAWAAGLAVMSTYTSSISYIATPGKAFDDNWNPIIFSVCIIPVAWFTCRYVVSFYRKMNIISVYQFLEDRLGAWARAYAAFCFLLLMIGRTSVILFLASLLLSNFVPWHLGVVIVSMGVVTIIYTLLGGMEAVIWTDVMQSVVMIVGIMFCAISLSIAIFSGSSPLIQAAVDAHKFSWGSLDFSLTSRTVWVVMIYGIVENFRNLVSDQNFVQKYSSVATEGEAKRSIWIAMLIYIPLTAVFLYMGTALFAFYSPGGELLPDEIRAAGDKVFPYYIATQVPVGLKGLIIAAIIAAAMSTVDSALNCSATVYLLDFHKRYINADINDTHSVKWLRIMTVVSGVLGIGFALLCMLGAESMLDLWWKIAGIFGGAILGLFVLALFQVRLTFWQGITSIVISSIVIGWGTFARSPYLPESLLWMECRIDGILIGAMGTFSLLMVALVLSRFNASSKMVD
jgi:solute:Na+ symporter, SSS family